MENFVELLKKLLVAEFFCTEEDAGRLLKENPDIVMQGIPDSNLSDAG